MVLCCRVESFRDGLFSLFSFSKREGSIIEWVEYKYLILMIKEKSCKCPKQIKFILSLLDYKFIYKVERFKGLKYYYIKRLKFDAFVLCIAIALIFKNWVYF